MDEHTAGLPLHGCDAMLRREVASEWHSLQCSVFMDYMVQQLGEV